MRFFFTLLVVGAVVVAALWAAQYDSGPIVINRADEYRLVLRFGEPVAELTDAGIARADYFGVAEGPFIRLPFMDEVLVFDKRIQYLNAAASEIEIGGNERLIVDYYALWRIDSPLAFRRSFPGGVAEARERIQRTVGALVGAAVGNLTMGELLSRAEVLESLDEQASEQLSPNGVRVVEVRINRTELPLPTETATFEQMREQRRAISREKRAIGERQAREIRAKAEREARELVAEARAQAEVVRGEGDAESARIYAGAYGRDPDFYAFVRSLEAYRKTLKQNTTLVVPPDHEFFRFLDEPARAR
ncbi:MAG: protease modulator HflC [Spirochaetaceae bacterium]|nr:protease modulator HflC [Spirochaetaceae bacterium]